MGVLVKEYKPGVYDDINEKDYHASNAISKHGLDLIARTPAHYKYSENIDNPAFAFGRAIHCFVLEPERFNTDFILSPYDDFRTKAAREWKEENKDKTIYTESDYEALNIMRDKLHSHPMAGPLLDVKDGHAEQSIFWIDENTNCLCRCRPDYINYHFMYAIDLKTCINAGQSAFARDVARYRYHVQAAFYLAGLEAAKIYCDDFIFVAIEKTKPYAVACYDLDNEALDLGRYLYRRDMEKYRESFITDVWPGYPEDVRTIQLPPWASNSDIS